MTPLSPHLRTLGLVGTLLLLWPAASPAAETPQIYDGMTPRMLGDFAERQGWRAEVSDSSANVVIHVGDERLDITLLDCDARRLCRSGLIRHMTYYFLKGPKAGCLWHWNLESKGATGFGPSYVTLQRYMQFRGITDQYLRDVFATWLEASPSFWELVRECYGDQPD